MTGYAGSRDYVGTCSLRGGPNTDQHIPLKIQNTSAELIFNVFINVLYVIFFTYFAYCVLDGAGSGDTWVNTLPSYTRAGQLTVPVHSTRFILIQTMQT